MSRIDLSTYLVTDAKTCETAGRTVLETVLRAVEGGVTTVQLREKQADARDFLDLVVAVCRTVPERVAVIVNDRVDVFLAARELVPSIAGVHVGQRDLPVELVRTLVGPSAIVGLTASQPAQLHEAEHSRAAVDYVGIGTVHRTPTKADAPEPIGLDEVVRRAAATSLPAVAIGGITEADVPALRAGGIAGIAVVSAICAAADPTEAARRIAKGVTA